MSKNYFFPPNPVVPTRVTNTPWIPARYSVKNLIDEDRNINCESNDDFDSSNSLNCISDDDLEVCHEEVELNTSGKWMLFFDDTHEIIDRGMTQHDYAWQFIKRLVEERGGEVGMYSAKCSTGWAGRHLTRQVGDSNGLICCYSRNYFDKPTVKRIADAIREVVDYPTDMFFKTDNDTLAGNYTCFGGKHVSIYKHTVKSEMFERDKSVKYKWNKVHL